MGLFFKLDKEPFVVGKWAELSSSSKQVLFPICRFLNKEGNCFPSIDTLCDLGRISRKTCIVGVKGLIGFHGFRVKKVGCALGKFRNFYSIRVAGKNKGSSIFVDHSILTLGTFSKLKPTAKALLPILLCFISWELEMSEAGSGFGNFEELCLGEDRGKMTPWEKGVVNLRKSKMAELAGITPRSVNSALMSLEEEGLVGFFLIDGVEKLIIYRNPFVDHYASPEHENFAFRMENKDYDKEKSDWF